MPTPQSEGAAAAPAATASATSAPAPAATTTADTATAAPSPDASSTSSQTAQTTPDFDWDAWDGSVDVLPETARPFAPHFEKFYTSQVDALNEEMARYRSIYESYINGKEDPRLGEMQGKLTAAEQLKAQIEAERDAAKREFETYRSSVEARENEAREAYIAQYTSQHKWMFDGGPLEAAADKLFDAGFTPDEVPVVLRQPQSVRERIETEAAALKAAGVPNFSTLAIRLARAEFRDPEPDVSASIISGAGVTNSASSTEKPTYKTASISEIARDQYRAGVAKHGRRS